MTAYTLVVAGSRTLQMDDSEFDHWMNHGLEVLGTPTKVIQGGARGVDRSADRWAYQALIDRETWPADWKRYGKRAGYVRNVDMAVEADKALILWDGKSPGTRMMIDLVVNEGMPSMILTFDEVKVDQMRQEDR